MTGVSRIPPGGRRELGLVNAAIARVAGLGFGGRPPNVFTTLGRHRGLFRRWLLFAAALMPGGRLPRRDSELVILRVAHLCGSGYEWDHHVRLGRQAGLTDVEVDRVRVGPSIAGWSARDAALLGATDQLHERRTLDDEAFGALSTHLSEVEVIELCMLAGHYEMLAMTLNALRVQLDPPPRRSPRLLRLLESRRRA